MLLVQLLFNYFLFEVFFSNLKDYFTIVQPVFIPNAFMCHSVFRLCSGIFTSEGSSLLLTFGVHWPFLLRSWKDVERHEAALTAQNALFDRWGTSKPRLLHFLSSFLVYLHFLRFAFLFRGKEKGKKRAFILLFITITSLSPPFSLTRDFFFFYFYFVLLYFSHLAPYNHSVTDRMGLPSPPEE